MRSRIRALYRFRARPDGWRRTREVVTQELSGRITPPMLDELEEVVEQVISHLDEGSDDATSEAEGRTITLDVAADRAVRFAVTASWEASAAGSERDT